MFFSHFLLLKISIQVSYGEIIMSILLIGSIVLAKIPKKLYTSALKFV